jgi:hypothetical protein
MAIALERNEGATQPATQEDLRQASKGIREDFIVIFGLFASLLIFLGVEIQVFQKAPRFSMMVGFSSFILGAMLTFLLGIYNIVKDRSNFKDYFRNPIFYFILACFIMAIGCFYWASFHNPKSNQEANRAQAAKIDELEKQLQKKQKTTQESN